jgi:hypothetical protein
MAGGLRVVAGSSTTDEYGSKWIELAAAAAIGALPIVITFLIAQKAIVSGLTQGSVKGSSDLPKPDPDHPERDHCQAGGKLEP